MVMRDLLKELLERYASAEGRERDWSSYRYSARATYDPELMKLVLTEMLEEAGVQILFNTWISQSIAEQGVVKGIIFENKMGRLAAIGKCLIDCKYSI